MWLIPTQSMQVKRAIDMHGVQMIMSKIRREEQIATSGWWIILLGVEIKCRN